MLGLLWALRQRGPIVTRMSIVERTGSLRTRIAEATRLLRQAEADLDEQVGLLQPVLKGDKHMSSEALERSFERLISARRALSSLEQLLLELAPE